MIAFTFKVGKYTVTASAPEPESGSLLGVRMEWSPCVPQKLTRAERRAYEKGRTKAVSMLVEALAAEAVEKRLVIDPDPCATHSRLIH